MMCNDNPRFSGKVALVTGAGRGMGRAVALAFAREGAKVAVNDIVEEAADAVGREVLQLGADVIVLVTDVSQSSEASRMVEQTVSRFGRVDVLVNNAGIARTTSPLEDISDEEWFLVLAVNLSGVFYCTRAVLPHMKKQLSGKIVNISSSAGRSVSTFAGAHYTASKAGVLGLTRHCARETAPFNINVNAVAPGTIETEMLYEHASRERIEAEAKRIPLRRLGSSEDEAHLVLFLASEEASFITGATVDINGGELMM
jgi:NAD(P)-dependent dehydrogenase (short-subunit alcohol dehydrogenase family)